MGFSELLTPPRVLEKPYKVEYIIFYSINIQNSIVC